MYTYYKAEGYDCCGFSCVIYCRTKTPIRGAQDLARRLYCAETGNAIAKVYAPRLRYALAYAWHKMRHRGTTAENWRGECISAISL